MKKAAKHREKSIKNIFLLKTNPYFLEPTCGLEKLKPKNQKDDRRAEQIISKIIQPIFKVVM